MLIEGAIGHPQPWHILNRNLDWRLLLHRAEIVLHPAHHCCILAEPG
jgi:hypothetical protein